jgi:hypothetical protein
VGGEESKEERKSPVGDGATLDSGCASCRIDLPGGSLLRAPLVPDGSGGAETRAQGRRRGTRLGEETRGDARRKRGRAKPSERKRLRVRESEA